MASKKSKAGRKAIVLTPEQIIEVRALSQFLSKGQIADYLGISRNTFDAILERQEGIIEHYKKGRATTIVNVAKGLIQQAMDGNTTAAIFYLKTQAGWRENAGDDDGDNEVAPVTVNIGVVDATKPKS